MAQAQTDTWDGGGTDDFWASAMNWTGDIAVAGNTNEVLLFTGATRPTPSNNIGAGTTFDGFQFNTGADFIIGGNAVTLTGAGVALNNIGGTNAFNVPLTLNAARTFTSAAGTLDVGGTVDNGGFLLTVNGDAATNITGIVSGAGGLTKTGGGTLTLSVANTYIGPTTVDGGILSVSGGEAIDDASAVTVNAGGTLNVVADETLGSLAGAGAVTLNAQTLTVGADNTSTEYSGAASGTGNLTKGGTGTLILSGTNIFTGVLTLGTGMGVGIVQAGTDAGLGAGSLTFNDHTLQATAAFDTAKNVTMTGVGTIDTQGFDQTFSGVISGASALTKAGTGTLTLSGDNTNSGGIVLNDGRIAVGSNTALGTGALNVTNAGNNSRLILTGSRTIANNIVLTSDLRVDTDALPSILSGDFSGAGNFSKFGTGTLTINGTGTNMGTSTISEGTLNMQGNWSASAMGVGVGAQLMGTGTVANLTVSNTARVAPGTSIGTLNVAGTATFSNGSILEVEVDHLGNEDLLVATGVATFDAGSNVEVLPQGVFNQYNAVTNYTILTAGGGIVGAPATITSTVSPTAFTGLIQTLTVAGNDLNLRLEYSSAAYDAALRPFLPDFVDVAAGDLGQIVNTFTDTEKNQIIPNAGAAMTQLFSSQPDNQINSSVSSGDRAIQMVFSSVGRKNNGGTQVTSAAGQQADQMAGSLGLAGIASAMMAPPRIPLQDGINDKSVWFQGYYLDGQVDPFMGAPTIDHDTAGFVLGYDWEANDSLVLGVMFGYSDTDTDRRGFNITSEAEHIRFGFYGDWTGDDGWYGKALGMYTDADFSSRRQVVFGTIDRTATASFDGDEISISGEVGKIFRGEEDSSFFFKPHLQLTYRDLEQDGFSETGAGNFNMTVAGRSRDMFQSALGAQVYWVNESDEGTRIIPELTLRWAHMFSGTDAQSIMNFESSPVTFISRARPLDENAGQVRAGITCAKTNGLEYHIQYLGDFASNQTIHGGMGTVTYRF